MIYTSYFFAAATHSSPSVAGTKCDIVITINEGGVDKRDCTMGWQPFRRSARAEVSFIAHTTANYPEIDTDNLTDSSIRVGIRGNDLWCPKHVVIWGTGDFRKMGPVAMETDIDTVLSSDVNEGRLTMPIRLVGLGGADVPIKRVLLIVKTGEDEHSQTGSGIEFKITIAQRTVVCFNLADADCRGIDERRGTHFSITAAVPGWTRSDLNDHSISLKALGNDAWKASRCFVFGLDTEVGRPNVLVPLVAIYPHDFDAFGWLSTDSNEGQEKVYLPICAMP